MIKLILVFLLPFVALLVVAVLIGGPGYAFSLPVWFFKSSSSQ